MVRSCVSPQNLGVLIFSSKSQTPTKHQEPRLDDDPMMKRVRTVQQNRVWGGGYAYHMINVLVALVPRFRVILIIFYYS